MKTMMIIGALILALSACSSKNIQSRMKDLKDNSVTYQQGYNDGCSSRLNKSDNIKFLFIQDIVRYKAGSDYSSGWDAGYQKCQ